MQKNGLYALSFKTVLHVLPRSNNKGLPLGQFINQIIVFMMGRTEPSNSGFEERKPEGFYYKGVVTLLKLPHFVLIMQSIPKNSVPLLTISSYSSDAYRFSTK